MPQLKTPVSVTNGSPTVTATGNFASQILLGFMFMVDGELVPYTVAANSSYSAGTGKTSFTLTGNYAGVTNTSANGVVVTDYTYPQNIPTISQGDVGTASIFTKAMYRIQELFSTVVVGTTTEGRSQPVDGSNLNTVTRTGFYRGSGMTNAPSTGWYYIINEVHIAGQWQKQTATAFSTDSNTAGDTFIRVCSNGSWGAWKKITTS